MFCSFLISYAALLRLTNSIFNAEIDPDNKFSSRWIRWINPFEALWSLIKFQRANKSEFFNINFFLNQCCLIRIIEILKNAAVSYQEAVENDATFSFT